MYEKEINKYRHTKVCMMQAIAWRNMSAWTLDTDCIRLHTFTGGLMLWLLYPPRYCWVYMDSCHSTQPSSCTDLKKLQQVTDTAVLTLQASGITQHVTRRISYQNIAFTNSRPLDFIQNGDRYSHVIAFCNIWTLVQTVNFTEFIAKCW